jgi:hypothetical protein
MTRLSLLALVLTVTACGSSQDGASLSSLDTAGSTGGGTSTLTQGTGGSVPSIEGTGGAVDATGGSSAVLNETGGSSSVSETGGSPPSGTGGAASSTGGSSAVSYPAGCDLSYCTDSSRLGALIPNNDTTNACITQANNDQASCEASCLKTDCTTAPNTPAVIACFGDPFKNPITGLPDQTPTGSILCTPVVPSAVIAPGMLCQNLTVEGIVHQWGCTSLDAPCLENVLGNTCTADCGAKNRAQTQACYPAFQACIDVCSPGTIVI